MSASRRRFLFGAGATAASFVAAPAIVRVAANLMPVKPVRDVIRGYEIVGAPKDWRFEVTYGSLKVGDTFTISAFPGRTYQVVAQTTA